MRALFDITHPAHVHLFKNAIKELQMNGDTVSVLSREKEVTTDLLDAYDIDHTVLSAKGNRPVELAIEWTLRELRTIKAAYRFQPDVIVSHISPSAVHAAKIVGAESVVFNDQEHPNTVPRLTAPLTSAYCTPNSYSVDHGEPHRQYAGFHELAYLHPDRFEADHDILHEHGVDPTAPYFLLRFVSMSAHHDVGEAGISPTVRRALAATLAEHAPVYVSSEDTVPDDLPADPMPVPPAAMHDLLAEASLLVTDSATMALESGVLGTPVVRSNSIDADGEFGALAELAKYDLVQAVSDEEVVAVADRLSTDPNATARWQQRRHALLDDTIDVTGYAVDVIREVADGAGG